MSEHLQLKLFDDSINVRALGEVRRLVLAHFGNHDDGLCAAYLCVAADGAEDEKIKGWSHTELLWTRSSPIAVLPGVDAPAPSGPTAPPPPEREADGEPRLRREKTKKKA